MESPRILHHDITPTHKLVDNHLSNAHADENKDLACFQVISAFDCLDLKCLELNSLKTIYIKTMSGRTIEFITNGLDTVDSLNDFITEKEGVPTDQQRLVFAGKQLESGNFLSDYNIKNGDSVSLVLRLRGGMHHPTSNGLVIDNDKYERQLMIQILMDSLTTDEEFDLIDMADTFRVEDD